MIRQCFETETGILFDSQGLKTIGLDPASLYPHVVQRPPPLPLGNLKLSPIPSAKSVAQSVKDKAGKNYAGESEEVEAHALTEEEHDLQDALSPVYDQLSLAWWFWWIMELLPMKHKFQRAGNSSWSSSLRSNLWKARIIPGQSKKVSSTTYHTFVHRSVKTRMEAEDARGKKYKPAAHLNLERVVWED